MNVPIRLGVITHYNDNERPSLHHYCNDNGNVMKDFDPSVMVMIMKGGNDHYIVTTVSLHLFSFFSLTLSETFVLNLPGSQL